MKRRTLAFALFVLLAAAATAQPRGRTLISLNPMGPLYGLYSVTVERVVSRDLSVVVTPTYFNLDYSAFRATVPEGTIARYAAVRLGINHFPYFRAPAGFFLGGQVQLGHMSLADASASASGLFIAPAGMIGTRFFVGRLGIAPRLRVGYAVALFDSQSVEIGDRLLIAPTSLEWDFGVGLSFAL